MSAGRKKMAGRDVMGRGGQRQSGPRVRVKPAAAPRAPLHTHHTALSSASQCQVLNFPLNKCSYYFCESVVLGVCV